MREKLGNLQALRGVAALLVVLFHGSVIEFYEGIHFAVLSPFHVIGYAGVDLFFVLSGFIIAFVHRDWFGQAGRVPTFVFRRVWRIFPAYWAALALGVAWLYFSAGTQPLSEKWLERFGRSVALLPDVELQPWVGQAWTLSYELAFYAAFALLLLLPRHRAARVLIAWFAVVCFLNLKTHRPANPFSVLWFSPLVAEFLAGAAVGWLVRPGWSRGTWVMLAAAITWIAAGLLLADRSPYDLQTDLRVRVLVWGVPCALMVAAFASADLHGRRMLPRWLETLGEASYSIYLVHLLVREIVQAAWSRFQFGHAPLAHTVWIAATIGIAVGFGLLFHWYVEKPCVNVMARWKKKPATAKPESVPMPERRAA